MRVACHNATVSAIDSVADNSTGSWSRLNSGLQLNNMLCQASLNIIERGLIVSSHALSSEATRLRMEIFRSLIMSSEPRSILCRASLDVILTEA